MVAHGLKKLGADDLEVETVDMLEALRRGNLILLGQLCSCIIVKEGHAQAVLHQGQIKEASSSITNNIY